jgi:hypothetical protein
LQLAACLRIPYPPFKRGDTSWHVWLSMTEGLVSYHIDFSALYYSSTAWNCVT